jgi:hypothetical protein
MAARAVGRRLIVSPFLPKPAAEEDDRGTVSGAQGKRIVEIGG